MIKFTKSSVTKKEEEYVLDVLRNSILSGDGNYTFKVYEDFKRLFGIETMLLTTSGTTALEMASLLIDLQSKDEVIVPSFTFSSTVNAFLLRGAIPVFCDIREDTMNIDENLIESLITSNTKAIYAVDYAGIPCEMDKINAIADKYGLFVIEDAAQAVGSFYKGRPAGTLSEFGCYSFHETKNYVMGEGGAIVLNKKKYLERAEIIREKGTNRRQVLNGVADKYTWHDIGSSFLPSDILAAILHAQLERYEEIMEKRVKIWNAYYDGLEELEKSGKLRRLTVPNEVQHNGHMFNIVLPSAACRTRFIADMKEHEILTYIAYIPLHSSPMGEKLGWKPEDCPITEDLGNRTVRLPLYPDMLEDEVKKVIAMIYKVL
ncbi:MAG: dTDP-4-amino-4,6-dideoxygalactose transaminase [Lachnospiraceae bacterium]